MVLLAGQPPIHPDSGCAAVRWRAANLRALSWMATQPFCAFAAHRLRFALRSLQVEEAQRKAAEAAAEQQGLARGSAPVRRKQVGHAPVRRKQAGRGVAGSGFAWLLPFADKNMR